MKSKRILSMLLAVIMLSSAIMAAIPSLSVSAANSAPSKQSTVAPNMYIKDGDEKNFKTLAEFKKQIAYSSAEAMLAAELAANQLISANSEDGNYTIYVNPYTGFMYYQNRITGQVLMSNDYDYSDNTSSSAEMLSQINVEYYPMTTTAESAKTIYSYLEAAARDQISVTRIKNGLRVNYTLGDTTLRYLVPGAISLERFYRNIVLPILDVYLDAVVETISANDQKLKPVYNDKAGTDGKAEEVRRAEARKFFKS